jgi:hypothetical protein
MAALVASPGLEKIAHETLECGGARGLDCTGAGGVRNLRA